MGRRGEAANSNQFIEGIKPQGTSTFVLYITHEFLVWSMDVHYLTIHGSRLGDIPVDGIRSCHQKLFDGL
jgi:hypothetical protein